MHSRGHLGSCLSSHKYKTQRILDPVMSRGRTRLVTFRERRRFIGIDQDPTYFEVAKRRIQKASTTK